MKKRSIIILLVFAFFLTVFPLLAKADGPCFSEKITDGNPIANPKNVTYIACNYWTDGKTVDIRSFTRTELDNGYLRYTLSFKAPAGYTITLFKVSYGYGYILEEAEGKTTSAEETNVQFDVKKDSVDALYLTFSSELVQMGKVMFTIHFMNTPIKGTYRSVSWLVDDSGILTFSGSGDIPTIGILEPHEKWLRNRTNIQSVIIENGITGIGQTAFQHCFNLKSIFIPDSVTSIGYDPFRDCPSLSQIIVESDGSYAAKWARANGYGKYVVIKSKFVPVSSAAFPDANFRSYISETVDVSPKDGFLSKKEISNTKRLWPISQDIASLAGLEYFTNLVYLNCFNNPEVTEINLQNNKKLEYLCIDICSIGEVDLSNTPNLKEFHCTENGLTSLDLSKNTALEKLYCQGNMLTSLDLSQNTKLRELCCFANCFHALDVGNCPVLNNLLHTEERKADGFLYDWGTISGKNGFIRIDNETVFLNMLTVLNLPSSLTVIEYEAFSGLDCEAVIIPDSCISIRPRAFAGCSNLVYVRIPISVVSFPGDVFSGCDENLIIDWVD